LSERTFPAHIRTYPKSSRSDVLCALHANGSGGMTGGTGLLQLPENVPRTTTFCSPSNTNTVAVTGVTRHGSALSGFTTTTGPPDAHWITPKHPINNTANTTSTTTSRPASAKPAKIPPPRITKLSRPKKEETRGKKTARPESPSTARPKRPDVGRSGADHPCRKRAPVQTHEGHPQAQLLATRIAATPESATRTVF
jgi:hypothetical protein